MSFTPNGPLILSSGNFSTLSVSTPVTSFNGIYSPFPSGSDIIPLPNNVITPITFTEKLGISSITVNGSTFTCNQSGYYLFSCSTLFFADQITSNLIVRDINTGVILGGNQMINSINNSYTGVVYLTSDQEFRIDVYQNSGSAKNIIGPLSFGMQLNLFIQKLSTN